MSYGLSFAAISSLIVYTYLHYRKQVWRQYKDSANEKPDIHMKLMKKYKEAPAWWYMSLFVTVRLEPPNPPVPLREANPLPQMLGLGLYTVLAYPTKLTWWAFLLAVAISYGFSLPIGIIEAVTNNQIGLNVLTEFIFGYIQPGRPLALMLCVALSSFPSIHRSMLTRDATQFQDLWLHHHVRAVPVLRDARTADSHARSQALAFVSDLKFGHYMKIPPRTMFWSQVVATTFSCFVQIAVLNLALGNIDDVCDPQQRDRFTCPGGRVFFAGNPPPPVVPP